MKLFFNNTMVNKNKKTNIVLRGHIRYSFKNENLYNLIKKIYNNNKNIHLYISTYDILQNNISWRKLEQIDIKVTKEMIINYFKDISHIIKKIFILSEKKSKLIGETQGKIGKGPAPLLGWKKYWLCKYEIINFLYNSQKNNNELVISMRFDIFKNSNNLTENTILQFIKNSENKNVTKNVFINNYLTQGIDNIYIGNIETQYKLISYFHFYLDEILKNYPNIVSQEHLVFIENNKLFNNTFII